jgi:hypothetical protein
LDLVCNQRGSFLGRGIRGPEHRHRDHGEAMKRLLTHIAELLALWLVIGILLAAIALVLGPDELAVVATTQLRSNT